MLILGFYEGHNSSCSIVEDGRILYSVEEERLSRIKGHDGRNSRHGMPHRSLQSALDFIAEKSIDKIALALEPPALLRAKAMGFWADAIKNDDCPEIADYFVNIDNNVLGKYLIGEREYHDISFATQNRRLADAKNLLSDRGLDGINIELFGHHDCHHASCFYTRTHEKGIIFSLDGRGDALSGMVSTFSDGQIQVEKRISSLHSIGHFYSAITVALGFKAVKHEGKITGLAAFGVPCANLLAHFKSLVNVSDDGLCLKSKLFRGGAYGPYPFADFQRYIDRVSYIISGYPKEVIAATAQKHIEEVICEWIANWARFTKQENVYLCGGVFSNVKLNQRVAELGLFSSVTVHPGMTDCGLSLGAALKAFDSSAASELKDCYLGPRVHDEAIESILESLNSKYLITCPENMALEAANLLAEKKIIARFSGRLEYGPRALGNRSILYHAGDPTANDWLNKQLNRTEFMPFAPVTLAHDAKLCYEIPNSTDVSSSLQFMTMTVNCTDYMKKICPAVVHIDGTARPQLVHSDVNPDYYDIINEYKLLTGIGTIVNTSFNLHDEPIVNTVEEAVRAFVESGLDGLILGKYLVLLKEVM